MPVSLRVVILASVYILLVPAVALIFFVLIAESLLPQMMPLIANVVNADGADFGQSISALTFSCVEARTQALTRVIERRLRLHSAEGSDMVSHLTCPSAAALRDLLFNDAAIALLPSSLKSCCGAYYAARFNDGATVFAAATEMMSSINGNTNKTHVAVYRAIAGTGDDAVVAGSAFMLTIVHTTADSSSISSSRDNRPSIVSADSAMLKAAGLLQSSETMHNGELWKRFFTVSYSFVGAVNRWAAPPAWEDPQPSLLRFVAPVVNQTDPGGVRGSVALVSAVMPLAELQARFSSAGSARRKRQGAQAVADYFILERDERRVLASFSDDPSISTATNISYFANKEVQKFIDAAFFSTPTDSPTLHYGAVYVHSSLIRASLPTFAVSLDHIAAAVQLNASAAVRSEASARFLVAAVLVTSSVFDQDGVSAWSSAIFFSFAAAAMVIGWLMLSVVTRSVERLSEQMLDPWSIVEQKQRERERLKDAGSTVGSSSIAATPKTAAGADFPGASLSGDECGFDGEMMMMMSGSPPAADGCVSDSFDSPVDVRAGGERGGADSGKLQANISSSSTGTKNTRHDDEDDDEDEDDEQHDQVKKSIANSNNHTIRTTASTAAATDDSSSLFTLIDRLNFWCGFEFEELQVMERNLLDFGHLIKALRAFMTAQDFLGISTTSIGMLESSSSSSLSAASPAVPVAARRRNSTTGAAAESPARLSSSLNSSAGDIYNFKITSGSLPGSLSSTAVPALSEESSPRKPPSAVAASLSDLALNGASAEEDDGPAKSLSPPNSSKKKNKGVTFAASADSELVAQNGSGSRLGAGIRVVPFTTSPLNKLERAKKTVQRDDDGGGGGSATDESSDAESGADGSAVVEQKHPKAKDDGGQHNNNNNNNSNNNGGSHKGKQVTSASTAASGSVAKSVAERPFVALAVCVNMSSNMHDLFRDQFSQEEDKKLKRELIERCSIVASGVCALLQTTGATLIEFRGDHVLLAVRMRSDRRRSGMATRFVMQLMRVAAHMDETMREMKRKIRGGGGGGGGGAAANNNNNNNNNNNDLNRRVVGTAPLFANDDDGNAQSNRSSSSSSASSSNINKGTEQSRLQKQQQRIQHRQSTGNLLCAGVSVGFMRTVSMTGDENFTTRSVSFVGGCFGYACRLERYVRTHWRQQQQAAKRDSLAHVIAVETAQTEAFYAPLAVPIGDMTLPNRTRKVLQQQQQQRQPNNNAQTVDGLQQQQQLPPPRPPLPKVHTVPVSRLMSLRAKASVLTSESPSPFGFGGGS